jgi:hypothetical protein
MIATLINGTIEQGVSYQIYLTGMGVMLGIFITVVGFMFNNMQTGFDKAALDRKTGFEKVGTALHSHDLAFTKIETLLSLYLLKDGISFEEQEKAVKKAQAEVLVQKPESSSD